MLKKIMILVSTVMLLISCQNKTDVKAKEAKPASKTEKVIFTTIGPVKFIAQKIAGTDFKVKSLLQEGAEPHSFAPTPQDIIDVNKSSVYFTIGMPLERKIKDKFSEKDVKMIDVSQGVTRRNFADHEKHNHGEGEDHKGEDHKGEDHKGEDHKGEDHKGEDHKGEDHKGEDHKGEDHKEKSHGKKDPHIWLGIDAIKTIAKNINDHLATISPELKDKYQSNYQAFLSEIDSIDQEIKKDLEPYNGKSILVFHPAFGYYTDRYGLEQKHVEISGKSPSAKQLLELKKEIREEAINVVFVQPQFDKTTAEKLAEEMKIEVSILDPLNADLFNNLLNMKNNIVKSFTKE